MRIYPERLKKALDNSDNTEYQRQGIGKNLLQRIKEKYKNYLYIICLQKIKAWLNIITKMVLNMWMVNLKETGKDTLELAVMGVLKKTTDNIDVF